MTSLAIVSKVTIVTGDISKLTPPFGGRRSGVDTLGVAELDPGSVVGTVDEGGRE